jgi:hypothetical protein
MISLFQRARIGPFLVVFLVAALGPSLTAAEAALPRGQQVLASCPGTWKIAPSRNVGDGSNGLAAIDVVSPQDIWAVGNTGDEEARSTLIEHWNGSAWAVVPSPNGAEPINWLTGVSAVSATDIWAVGFTNDGNGFESQSFTLTMHYDGTSWQVVPSPNPVPDPNPGNYDPSNELYAVHAISANDVWAVGHTFTVTGEQTLALHWDGTSWEDVPTPHPTRYSRLRSVDAAATDDIWAVGEIDRSGKQQTLTQHYDGTSWTTVPSPNEGLTVDYMSSVSVAAPDDVWVVGYHIEVIGFDQPYQTSSWHYDGVAWSLIDAPDMNDQNNYLRGVVTFPRGRAMAVGFWDTGTALLTLTERWNGTSWEVVPSPNKSDIIDELWAVDVASNRLWAVGQTFQFFSFRTMIQRFSC